MKRPQNKFHADSTSDSEVIRSKKVKICRYVEIFLCRATTTDIEMLLYV